MAESRSFDANQHLVRLGTGDSHFGDMIRFIELLDLNGLHCFGRHDNVAVRQVGIYKFYCTVQMKLRHRVLHATSLL